MNNTILSVAFLLVCHNLWAVTIHVGNSFPVRTLQAALKIAQDQDSIVVHGGHYTEGNLIITKSIRLIGLNFPVLDGALKSEVLSVQANGVLVEGFKVIRSGFAALDDPCGIKVYHCSNVIIRNNILDQNFFGIYLQSCKNCTVIDNRIRASGTEEQQIGNGIHCWKSDSIKIIHNSITGHRDGIYFEFVTHSIIWRNTSYKNIRYGLHFMFSNDDAYITNVFRENGAGVAVMYTKNVKMFNNVFEQSWGDAAYGLLLKDISDSHLYGNKFLNNTTGIHMEGTSRIDIARNTFQSNGWAIKISASCMDNAFWNNNFFGNTFDAGTNGTLVLNTFKHNYWDKYEGYDLNKDLIGDIPFHPLSLFSVVVEHMPSAMLLYRSFMITLLDKSEKILPSLTPDNFIDEQPLMRPVKL
jgi:nitrous oxidase accessory protein